MTELLKAGVKVVDITPPVGVMMGGYGDRKEPSKGVHDELLGQVLILSDDNHKVCFIVLDFLTVDLEFTTKLRSDIYSETGITPQNIQIMCTHTHAGPMGFRPLPPDSTTAEIKKQIDSLREDVHLKLLNAAVEAKKDFQQVYIEYGKQQAPGIATNRLNADGPMDNDVTTVVIRRAEKQKPPLAVLINFTCHPTVLNHKNHFFSGDYPHYVRQYMQKILKAAVPVLFTNGACGDVSTRFTRKGADFEEAKWIGYLVGEAGYKGLNTSPKPLRAALNVLQFQVDMPVKDLPGLEEAQKEYQRTLKAVEALDRQTASEGEIRLVETEFHGARANLNLVQYGYIQNTVAEINLISIGEAVFVTIPGELFVSLGNEIKRRSPFSHTVILGYSNDAVGYIPSKEAYHGTGYEARRTQFREGAGEYLVREIIEKLNAMRN